MVLQLSIQLSFRWNRTIELFHLVKLTICLLRSQIGRTEDCFGRMCAKIHFWEFCTEVGMVT
jgi:hypothetical protein